MVMYSGHSIELYDSTYISIQCLDYVFPYSPTLSTWVARVFFCFIVSSFGFINMPRESGCEVRTTNGVEMAPMFQPSPPVKGNKSTLNMGLSLGNTIHKLHDAILNIALPKTKTTKTVSIPIETLHLAWDLAGSVCMLLQEHHTGSQLDDISRQLEAIQTQLATPSKALLPQKLSYAATLAMGITSSSPKADLPPLGVWTCHVRQYDITLMQKLQDKPALISLSNDDMITRILQALQAADVCLEE